MGITLFSLTLCLPHPQHVSYNIYTCGAEGDREEVHTVSRHDSAALCRLPAPHMIRPVFKGLLFPADDASLQKAPLSTTSTFSVFPITTLPFPLVIAPQPLVSISPVHTLTAHLLGDFGLCPCPAPFLASGATNRQTSPGPVAFRVFRPSPTVLRYCSTVHSRLIPFSRTPFYTPTAACRPICP